MLRKEPQRYRCGIGELGYMVEQKAELQQL